MHRPYRQILTVLRNEMCEILLQSALSCAVPFPRQQSRTGLRQSALLVRRARLQHGFFLGGEPQGHSACCAIWRNFQMGLRKSGRMDRDGESRSERAAKATGCRRATRCAATDPASWMSGRPAAAGGTVGNDQITDKILVALRGSPARASRLG